MDDIDRQELLRGADAEMTCPICGRITREMRMCPAHDEEAVCMDCCRKCEYHIKNGFNPCGYHRENQTVNYEEELKKIQNKIDSIYQKIDYYYSRNWVNSALKKEKELDEFILEKRRLLEERNERVKDSINSSADSGSV